MNMSKLNIETFNAEALELFAETRQAFSSSSIENLKNRAQYVPENFVDEGKKVSIVFAGQYSAGKSSILSILTGQELEIGQGVTTGECHVLDWNGLEVVDTPGIHTQKRPDHDEMTYKAMADADLIVFVCTAEGFSEGLGNHFRKLLIEKGKGNEMMLVFNKMESSAYGNTEEGQAEFFAHDVLPVISPEYTAEDLYVSYIDVNCYLDAQDADGEDRMELLKMSGFDNFIENMNRFIAKKKTLGKCTTSLYKLEQMLSEAMAEFKSGDYCADGSIELLNQQRRLLTEAKERISNESYNLIRRKSQEVRNWGYDIANNLTSQEKEEEVNGKLEEKYHSTNSVYTEAARELEEIIKLENDALVKNVERLETTEFAGTLKSAIKKEIGAIKLSQETAGKLRTGSEKAIQISRWIAQCATGPKTEIGWNTVFLLGSFATPETESMLLQAGKAFGKQFKPWEAVKVSTKISKVGKVLGVGGVLLGIGLQIWDDCQEEKMQKQLLGCRSDIRNTFDEAANVIDMKFDEDTQSWIDANINPKIAAIDEQIKQIEDAIQSTDAEFNHYGTLIERTRTLISRIQENS